MAGVKSAEVCKAQPGDASREFAGDGGKRIRLRGEREISRKTIAQGGPDAPADTCMLVCVFFAHIAHETAGASQHPAFPAPLCPGNLSECANGRLRTNRPLLELSPLRPKATEPVLERGTAPVSSSTEQLQGLRARTEQGREWMMAQNEVVVVGIDVAKDKVDACIRASKLRQTLLSTARGHRKLVVWLRKHQVNKAVMEASGGYERDWARVLREAGVEVRIVDPKRVRSFALSAGRLAKNDAIDAEMIAWFAETFSEAPGQPHDAAQRTAGVGEGALGSDRF